MPRKRPDKELWYAIRIKVWERDLKKCTKCNIKLSINECHIDHIKSGILGKSRL